MFSSERQATKLLRPGVKAAFPFRPSRDFLALLGILSPGVPSDLWKASSKLRDYLRLKL